MGTEHYLQQLQHSYHNDGDRTLPAGAAAWTCPHQSSSLCPALAAAPPAQQAAAADCQLPTAAGTDP